MVVLCLGHLGDPVHEGDRVREAVEPPRPLERAVDLGPFLHGGSMHLLMTAPTLAQTRKERPSFEVMSELVFRPLAHALVRVLLPLRVPPPAVVLVGTAVGLCAAWLLWSGSLVWAAVLLQLKTLLDGADGQLARASGRVTVLGRYLDSESDLLVDAFLFAALGHVTGLWVLAMVAFFVLALVLSFDFGLELAWRRELGVAPREARPSASGLADVFGRIYDVVYTPHSGSARKSTMRLAEVAIALM